VRAEALQPSHGTGAVAATIADEPTTERGQERSGGKGTGDGIDARLDEIEWALHRWFWPGRVLLLRRRSTSPSQPAVEKTVGKWRVSRVQVVRTIFSIHS
jgi:hypothetical protein